MSYPITARRWARKWELDVDGETVTQFHGLHDAERMVRSCLDITDHADSHTAELTWTCSLGDEWVEGELAHAREAVADAAEAQVVAADRSGKIVRLLLDRGIKGSEVTAMTGLSKHRVSQLTHS